MSKIQFDISTPAGALDAIWFLAKQSRGLTRDEWAAYDKAYETARAGLTQHVHIAESAEL